jgi:two-component sensor histidine kinase
LAWRDWLPNKIQRPWQSVILAVALAGVATATRLAIHGPLGAGLPFITYFPALIVAAALGGWLGGLSCLAVATIAAIALFLRPDMSAAWALGSFWVSGALVIAVAAALADGVRELRLSRAELTDAHAQLQTLVGELAHRNRNALQVMMFIVSQSARNAPSAAAAEEVINARLGALLQAQEVIVRSDSGSASLGPLLEEALEPFGAESFALASSPEVEVKADVAVALGLLFHELATNAVKYGALSRPNGRVDLGWSLDNGMARVTWREVGGPGVAEPSKRGFGARLFDAALVPQGGKVERRFEPDGLVCELHVPVLSTGTPLETAPGVVFAAEAMHPAPIPKPSSAG